MEPPLTRSDQRRFDGESWRELADTMPALNYATVEGDRAGRAWWIGSIDEQRRFYRHAGLGPADRGWELLELTLPAGTQLFPAPDGLLLHDPRETRVFRWACE